MAESSCLEQDMNILSNIYAAAESAHRNGYQLAILAVKQGDEGSQYSFKYEGVAGKPCKLLEQLFKELVTGFGGTHFQTYCEKQNLLQNRMDSNLTSSGSSRINNYKRRDHCAEEKLQLLLDIASLIDLTRHTDSQQSAESHTKYPQQMQSPLETERRSNSTSQQYNITQNSGNIRHTNACRPSDMVRQNADNIRHTNTIPDMVERGEVMRQENIPNYEAAPSLSARDACAESYSYDNKAGGISDDVFHTDAGPDTYTPEDDCNVSRSSSEATPTQPVFHPCSTENYMSLYQNSANIPYRDGNPIQRTVSNPEQSKQLNDALDLRLPAAAESTAASIRYDNIPLPDYIKLEPADMSADHMLPTNTANNMFNRAQSFTFRHSDGHMPRPPRHQCVYCPYSSPHPGNLRQHIRTHTNEKPFKCTQCPYASPRCQDLKRHVDSIHKHLKPYGCRYCSFAATRQDNLKVHVQSKHGHGKALERSRSHNM